MSPSWICAQLGAREHYAIPCALDRSGCLGLLLTDAWVRPTDFLGTLHRGLGDRYHPDLVHANVVSSNAKLLTFEMKARALQQSGWKLTMERNRWFQRQSVKNLSSFPAGRSSVMTLFAYSYAALELLRFAKSRGWRTVLGQIDPGVEEERLVEKVLRQNPDIRSRWLPAPPEYWQLWREECLLADHIVVNSSWSRTALIGEGIPEKKIAIVPLAYEAPVAASDFNRSYPSAFSDQRPLHVLFLGQVNLRKGMSEVFDAMRLLQGKPIEFSIVGPLQFEIPADLRTNPRIKWTGPISRSAAADFYREADVFLFPTHSDGFGLTQLEAQAWKLPVIASRFCGDVVEHGRNGWLLSEITSRTISDQLLECMRNPKLLAAAASNSGIAPRHTLSSVSESLSQLVSR